ncbi:glycosyltransferase [Vibrio sp. 10N.222.51.C12]|uniref:glycosyltransferase n=1 Tax=Vibrio sp. 10N.222.51.C12 TaxID=3229622 RepID=UPI00354CC2DD
MRKRLVFVTNDEHLGGPNKVAGRVRCLLTNDFSTITIVQGSNEAGFENDNSERIIYPSSSILFLILFIFREIKQYKSSVYIVFGTKQSLLLSVLKIFFKSRLALIIRTGLNPAGSIMKKGSFFKDYLQLPLCRKLYIQANAIITETKSMCDWWLVEKDGQLLVRNINNPVKKFPLETSDLASLESLIGIASPVLLSIGRLSYQKDHDFLLKSFARYIDETSNKSAVLLILGDGEERNTLEKLSIELGINNNVNFVGHVPNVRPFLERADLYCLTSRWEGGVNSLIEAVYYNSRILALDCPVGPLDILSDIQGAQIIFNRSEDDFVAAMKQILSTEWIHSANKRNIDSYQNDYIKNQYKSLINEVEG